MHDTLLTRDHSQNLLGLIGVIPITLAIAAILLGILAIIKRKGNLSHAISAALVGITLLGFATTAYRICEIMHLLSNAGAWDYTVFFQDVRYYFLPLVVILPACTIGFLLVAISWIVKKLPLRDMENMNPSHSDKNTKS